MVKGNDLKEKLLDQAQARGPYDPPLLGSFAQHTLRYGIGCFTPCIIITLGQKRTDGASVFGAQEAPSLIFTVLHARASRAAAGKERDGGPTCGKGQKPLAPLNPQRIFRFFDTSTPPPPRSSVPLLGVWGGEVKTSLCIAAAVCCFRPRSWRTVVLYMDPYPMGGGSKGGGGANLKFSTGGIVWPNYPIFPRGLKILANTRFVHLFYNRLPQLRVPQFLHQVPVSRLM